MNTLKTLPIKRAENRLVRKKFHIGFITPLTHHKNTDILLKSIEPLCELGFSLSMLAAGNEKAQASCLSVSQKHSENFKVLEALPANEREILNESQIIVFMEDPSLETIKKILKNEKIPLLPSNTKYSFFEDFDAQQETGNSFLYESENYWEFLATVLRAYENFKFSYDWDQIKKMLKKTETEMNNDSNE